MRAAQRRAGSARLQTLQAEMAATGEEKPVKSLASYFSARVSAKTTRPKPSTPGA